MRVLIVRLRGGFNDCLCELVKCLQYCRVNSRHLIVESFKSGMHDSLGRYFKINVGAGPVTLLDRPLSGQFPASVFPTVLAGGSFDYAEFHEKATGLVRLQSSGVPLTFDFSVNYQEEVLLHEQFWSGPMRSPMFFEFFSFKDAVLQDILKRLLQLPPIYESVHIRNTDYTTDYRSFLSYLVPTRKVPLLVCSDSSEVLHYARENFSGRVITLSNFENPSNEPLHARPISNQIELNAYFAERDRLFH